MADVRNRSVVRNEPATTVVETPEEATMGDGGSEQWHEADSVCGTVCAVLHTLRGRVAQMPPSSLFRVVLIVLLLLCGGAMQVIFLNHWLDAFPGDVPGNYTTLTVSAILFSVFFLAILATYVVTCRPDMRFAWQPRSLGLLVSIGFADAANSTLAIYSASHTSEVLQAIFLSLVPVYAAVFTKVFLRDRRRYMNPFVVVGFTLLISGICLASSYLLFEDDTSDERHGTDTAERTESAFSRKCWVFLFFLSVPFTVLVNVGQTVYMLWFTDDMADRANVVFVEGVIDGASGDSQASESARDQYGSVESVDHPDGRPSDTSSRARFSSAPEAREPGVAPNGVKLGDDIAVKLVMLAGGTTVQALLCLLWLPMDALPWYGGSSSVSEAWTNLIRGLDCLFNCPNNLAYGALYSAGFVLVYIGAAYLNQYSVTLCAMVSQLSGPVTALLLIVFPALNVTGDAAPWYVSLVAVCLLVAGTFVYVVWDEKTASIKEAGELELKLEMHGSARAYERLEVDVYDY